MYFVCLKSNQFCLHVPVPSSRRKSVDLTQLAFPDTCPCEKCMYTDQKLNIEYQRFEYSPILIGGINI